MTEEEKRWQQKTYWSAEFGDKDSPLGPPDHNPMQEMADAMALKAAIEKAIAAINYVLDYNKPIAGWSRLFEAERALKEWYDAQAQSVEKQYYAQPKTYAQSCAQLN